MGRKMTEIQKTSRRYALGKIPLDNSRVIELIRLGISRDIKLRNDKSAVIRSTVMPIHGREDAELIGKLDLSDENIESVEAHYRPVDFNKKGVAPHIAVRLKVGNKAGNLLVIDMFEYVLFNHRITLEEAREIKGILDGMKAVYDLFNSSLNSLKNGITSSPLNPRLMDSTENYVELLRKNKNIPDDARLFLQLSGWA